jgi:hypothetical protein
MERIEFPSDFSEFSRLLNVHDVEYLLVGGFAVALHGYPRATADIDVWVARRADNAIRIVAGNFGERPRTSTDAETPRSGAEGNRSVRPVDHDAAAQRPRIVVRHSTRE